MLHNVFDASELEHLKLPGHPPTLLNMFHRLADAYSHLARHIERRASGTDELTVLLREEKERALQLLAKTPSMSAEQEQLLRDSGYQVQRLYWIRVHDESGTDCSGLIVAPTELAAVARFCAWWRQTEEEEDNELLFDDWTTAVVYLVNGPDFILPSGCVSRWDLALL